MVIELRSGTASAVIRPECGGRVTSLRFGGREHLADGAALEGNPWRGGCHPLAPWAGTPASSAVRIGDGVEADLPARPDGSRKHGWVDGREWRTVQATRSRAELRCAVAGAGAWDGECRQIVELGDDLLRITLSFDAAGDVPVALGLHPWFAREHDGSSPLIRFAPERRIVVDERGRETETTRPAPSPRDDLFRADGGSPRLEWTDGRALEVRSDAGIWVVYERDPLGVCVEPWTHTPGEFVRGAAPLRRSALTMELLAIAPPSSPAAATASGVRPRDHPARE